MSDEAAKRPARLAGATACFAGFLLIALAIQQGWQPLVDLDRWIGEPAQRFTFDRPDLARGLRVLAAATEVLPEAIATVVVAIALAARNHRRAAIWTVGVMATIALLITGLKQLFGRDRPIWDDPVAVLNNYSFPSGHAGGIAAVAGVAFVLVTMLVRRRGLRRWLIGLFLLLAAAVGADRVLLGVHYPSDVLAGLLLGTGVVLVWLAAFDPTPRSIARAKDPIPDAVPKPQRTVGVVLNPSKVEKVEEFTAMTESLALASGFAEVTWWHTTVEDTGHAMAHDAAVAGVDLVVAIGGDGTIRAVCEELAGTGIPVGIVPAGTGNLLARNLEIPLYLRAAVDTALNGQDRAIDLVRVSGDEMEDCVYLVMAGMGFDAAIMEGVNEHFKARVGWVAYVWAGLKALMFPAIRLEISVDGAEPTVHRARTVVIGNVGTLQAGMPLIPGAEIDDGELDVVLLYPRRFLSWLPLAARVLTKNPRTDDTITRMRGQKVVVRTTHPAPRQLDGDLLAPGRELHAECIHGPLLVRVPR